MGYLLSLSKPATTNWLDGSEIALLIGGLVLLIGLLGEHFASAGGVWLKRFAALVTIGCGIEFLADGGVFCFSTHLQSISDAKVIAAENDAKQARDSARDANGRAIEASNKATSASGQAADAFDRAATAENEAGENKLEAAKLQKEAEDERLERVRIEEALAPRRLTKEVRAEMTTRLRAGPFSWQPVSPWYQMGDFEGGTFTWDIALMLRDANWYVFKPASSMQMAGGGEVLGSETQSIPSGVRVSSTSDRKSRAAAEALVNALTEVGFDVTREPDNPKTGPMVWVNVAVRPIGPQGEAKLRAANANQTHAK
jgi:hypothetical protein